MAEVYSYMKAITSSLIIVFTTSVLTATSLLAETIEAKDAGDNTLKAILLDPKEYKNDHVTYTAPYGGFTANAPLFLDKNGFKEGKQVVISAGSRQLPVIADRNDVDTILLDLKRGSIVKVSGKVKEMKKDPKRGIGTGFYLELDSLEVVKEATVAHSQKKHMLHKKGAKKVSSE